MMVGSDRCKARPTFDFDRAFSYDQLGRLTQATTGGAVRGDSGGVPYHETMGYDPWNNLTARNTTTWSENTFSDSVSYANNRRPDWVYDADGRIKTIGSRNYTHNSVGQESSMTGQRWTPSGFVATTLTAAYDGDGNSTKTVFAGVVSYQVRSSVLGGAIVNEMSSSGQKQAGYVYYPSGNELATQNNNHVIWKHISPVNTTKIELHNTGSIDQVELDPTGGFVDLSPPSEPPQTQSGEINARNIGALMNSMYSALNNPASGCVVDWFETSCSNAMAEINHGTGADTAFTRTGATTMKDLANAVMLGMGPNIFARPGDSVTTLIVSGLQGTDPYETDVNQSVTYDGVTVGDVPVPTAYSGTVGTPPSVIVLNNAPILRTTLAGIAGTAKLYASAAFGKSSPLPDCVKKFLSQFGNFDQVVEAIKYSNDGIPFYVPIDARGFTLGDHIYFKEAAFDPSNGVSDGEMILLAHEVSHVVQYRQNGKLKMAADYLWQSAINGVAGFHFGGPLTGEMLASHLSYYGNEYEQDAMSTEDVVEIHIRLLGNPCR